MKKISSLIVGLLLLSNVFGQFKAHLKEIKKNDGPSHQVEETRLAPLRPLIPAGTQPFHSLNQTYRPIPRLVIPKTETKMIKAQYDGEHPTPIAIWGSTGIEEKKTSVEQKVFSHLQAISEYLQIKDPVSEFRITGIQKGENGYQHIRLQQYYRKVKVSNGQITLHFKEGKADFLSGRYYPTPSLTDLQPKTSEHSAVEKALAHVASIAELKSLSDFEQEILKLKRSEANLVIYHSSNRADSERLAWEITLVPNLHHRQTYFIDAHSGEIIFHYENVCSFHYPYMTTSPEIMVMDGPTTGSGKDLLGVTRTLNTYIFNNVNYLIDGSRSMFNIQASTLPSDPVGAIWTVDGLSGSPAGNSDFSVRQVTNAGSSWNNPTAVSAHYNAGKVFEYFSTTFNRNSIDGQGGTIISIFNVNDENGEEMDNAFWNGIGIFYGNGKEDFFPLAASLDVAAHEIGHGVTQTSANLEYIGQSGALNEHFSDVFGVMVDRDDWQLGETVTRPGVFPTGALRDMQNPNNGGSRLGHPGWQPDHMDEFQHLPLTEQGDNGGVHINSGIVNRAFVHFATAVGKEAAERIYYNALVNILTRSSQFIDMRLAIIESAKQLAPNNNSFAQAAVAAFDAVGIIGSQGTNNQEQLPTNTGSEFILFTDSDQSALRIYTADNRVLWNPLIRTDVISKPSITDDGNILVYVDGNQNINAIVIDWNTLQAQRIPLSTNGIWRNVAISRDGNRLAAVTDDFDNRIWVFDLESETPGKAFNLFNPSTVESIRTGDVAYADVLEWDFSGEFVMYDALTRLKTQEGNVEFWDIGFIRVWNHQTNNFGDNFISKLFSALPDNISVGNPTFAKNSPFIIAMDVTEDTEQSSASILGVNIETGDVGGIWEGSTLNSPNYSVNDQQLIFNAFDGNDNPILGIIDLQEDKINSVEGTAFIFIRGASGAGARLGTWFANGRRNLQTPVKPIHFENNLLKVYPNPFTEYLQIELKSPAYSPVDLSLFDSLGRLITRKTNVTGPGQQTIEWAIGNLPTGTYWLQVEMNGQFSGTRVFKGQ